MKHLFTLLLLLPGLGSCTLQDDNYREPPQSTAYVTKPYGHYFNNYQDRMATPQQYHSRERTGVIVTRPNQGQPYENRPEVYQQGGAHYRSPTVHGYHNNPHHGHD